MIGYEFEIPLRKGRREKTPTNLKESEYRKQIILLMVEILKVLPMNCSIQVPMSSGVLHMCGAALLMTRVGEKVEEVQTSSSLCCHCANL